MQTLTELLTGLELPEETADAIHSWVANRENELAAERNDAVANATATERAAQSAAMNEAQAAWDGVRGNLETQVETLNATIAELTDFQTRAMDGIGVISTAIKSGTDPAEVVAIATQAITLGLAPDNERKAAELRKQAAELQAQIDALESAQPLKH